MFELLEKQARLTRERSRQVYSDLVEAIHSSVPLRIKKFSHLNTGVFGFRKGDRWLEAWWNLCDRLARDSRLRSLSTLMDQSAMVTLLAAGAPLDVEILDEPGLNWPANGIMSVDRARRKCYDMSGPPNRILAEIAADHPEASVVHWVGRPKPWDPRPSVDAGVLPSNSDPADLRPSS